MRFCVIRHQGAGVGTCPESALPHNEANGWERVSDWADGADGFNLPEYAAPDPEPTPPAPPAKATKSKPAEATAKANKEEQ